MHRLSLSLAIAAALTAACGQRSSEPAAGSSAAAGSNAGAAPATPPANEYAAVIPKAPRRDTPPPSLATSALAVGADAPAIDALASTGRFVLADALTKHARVILVLYRGDW
ncbi:MAG: hypothetical protein R3B06_08570 [Kofleriaceae bacterium]